MWDAGAGLACEVSELAAFETRMQNVTAGLQRQEALLRQVLTNAGVVQTRKSVRFATETEEDVATPAMHATMLTPMPGSCCAGLAPSSRVWMVSTSCLGARRCNLGLA